MSKVKLGDVVVRIKDSVDRNNTDLLYYIGGEHFDERSLTVTRKGIIKGSTIGPAFSTKFRSGDVLLMSRNPHLRKAGMVNFEGICSDVSYIIRTRDENVIMQKFIPILFQSDAFWTFAEKNKKGSTNFFLNWSDFERFEFDLPDHETQEKLCKTLWAINDTLDSYKEMLKQSDEFVKAKFVEMFGDPILNDKSLPTKQLSQCITLKGPKEISPKDNVWNLNLDMVESGTGDIIQKVIVPRDKLGTSVYYFNNEYILYSKLRPYLNKVVLPDEDGYATTELVPMKPYDFINKTFLACLLRSDSFVNYINKLSFGAKMPRAPMDKIRNFPIILPQLELQSIFEKYVIEINQSKLILKKCILKLEALYKKIVNQYITKEENE